MVNEITNQGATSEGNLSKLLITIICIFIILSILPLFDKKKKCSLRGYTPITILFFQQFLY